MHLRVTSRQLIHMSFGSEVVVTRFNRRTERVNIMPGISHLLFIYNTLGRLHMQK